jgi:hypothetical protein
LPAIVKRFDESSPALCRLGAIKAPSGHVWPFTLASMQRILNISHSHSKIAHGVASKAHIAPAEEMLPTVALM